jgi:LmbE family N-acetylglucosaminyl deacetylase
MTAAPMAAQSGSAPSVLIVTAHPDDDAMFAATVYKITHDLGGTVDLALITDGAGGYRYSTLAEPIYGLDLTDKEVARQYLPAIRKQELMAGGKIIGIRNYFFLDQPDAGYTTNVDSVLHYHWDPAFVEDRLYTVMERWDYDFVFAHLPIEPFHGHHKAATILAIRTMQTLPPEKRPVVLGSFISSPEAPAPEFEVLPGFPVTRLMPGVGAFSFDRYQTFGTNNRLNYQIVVNWLIAEHKSQGTMQLLMNQGSLENFWIFEANGDGSVEKTQDLFDRINRSTPGR